jgi:phospholipid/cholesterol/gamma-HCH transport system substrate-binding protein
VLAVQSEWMPSARQVSWAKIRIAAVAIAAFAILSVLVYLLGAGTLFEEKSTLLLYVPDATGLSAGSLVRANGVDVGKVKSISLSGSAQPDRVVKLALTVEREYLGAIPADAFAQINSDTAIGDRFVDIDTTQSKSPTPVMENSELAFKPQQDLLKTLDIQQFADQLRSVASLLDDLEQGRNAAGQLLVSDELYVGIRRELGDFKRQIEKVASKTNPVGSMLYTDQFYRQIRQPLVELDQRLADLQAGHGQLAELLTDNAKFAQLRSDLVSIRRPIENFGKSSFLASDEQFKDWSRGLVALIQGVDSFNRTPVMSSSEFYDNLNGFATELRERVKEFRQDPRKFLRIGRL